MNFVDIIKISVPTLVRMAKSGTLRPKKVWCAVSGAGEYIAAAASGDVAPERVQQERVDTCDACPSATYDPKPDVNAHAVYCGRAFDDRRGALERPTCGCLVGVTIDGVAYAGGKTVVASHKCPQGKWGPVTRVNPAG